jgi:hypothetical protein
MAALEVTITGLLYDKWNRTTQNVVLIGEATVTGLGVGGGPMPPGGGGAPLPPWYPGHPEHPIPPTVWPTPPGGGGGQPPTGGAGPHPEHPIWPGAHPEHPGPIVPPTEPPPIDPATPPIEWKPVWTPETGWIVVGVPNVPVPTPSA